jgi:surface carbohydrate biosynthesis protein
MKNGNNSQVTVSDKITILAINADRFRGDTECLAQVSKFRVLTLDGKWESALRVAFTSKRVDIVEYIKAGAGDDIYKLKEKINIFFDGFISHLLKLIKVDCVITPNYRYIDDLFWVMSFAKKEIPHICLFREGLLITDRFYDGVTARHRLFKGHPVTHFIVHNQKCKDSFVESGFATDGQVSVNGALRMDYLVKQVSSNKDGVINRHRATRKRVILFYFSYKMSLFGKEKLADLEKNFGSKYSYVEAMWPHRFNLFRDLHVSIIRLAQKLPEVDFVIKPKHEMLTKRNTSWDEYLRIVDDMGIDLSKLKNYTIEPNVNVHDLIINSDVVIALQTSAVLEAAIAGKPVIFPLFYNYKETKNFNDFMWHNHLCLFDVAESAEEMEALIINRLENPEIENKNMDGRRELFKKWFSDLDGVALKKYSETIENIVASAKIKNQHFQNKSVEHGIEKSF